MFWIIVDFWCTNLIFWILFILFLYVLKPIAGDVFFFILFLDIGLILFEAWK